MADDLIASVVEFANAHPTLTDASAFGDTSWLWLGMAPQDQGLPHGTITSASATPSYHSKDEGGAIGAVVEATFNLSVYSTLRSNCARLVRLVQDVLTDAPLSFADGRLMSLRPGSITVDLDPDPGPSGEDVWAGVIQFNATIDTL